MEFVDTKLHEAVRYGDTNLVESALRDGLDPNAIGLYRWSPLHEAASAGDLDILWLLLQFKGDPNCKDDLNGCTPVHYACMEGHAECLQALLDMGGRCDIANADGETGLDVAIGKCRALLDEQRDEELIQESVKGTLEPSRGETKAKQDSRPESPGKDCEGSTSPTPSLRDGLPTAWDSIEVQETRAEPLSDAGTGFLQLSFEYNSHTSILKIRVWKLEDILLPPAEIASITRISVRSRLLPDKKGETKRKTEEAKIEDLEKMRTSIVSVKRKVSKESFKAIYLPCVFHFTRPLEYKSISKDTVAAKTLHLDVNVKQRYSSKSFTVANLQLPLREAVRRLRKARYRLHPCINYSMPDNIHSYDPRDLVIVTEGMYSNKTVSNPNLRAESKNSLRLGAEDPRRATSDINLKSVRCHSVESLPSVSLSIPSDELEDEEEEEDSALRAIAVLNDSPRSASSRSQSNPEVHVVEIHEMNTLPGAAEEDLAEVTVEAPRRKHSTSSPNIPILLVEDLEAEAAPKRLNRPTSPPNRLAVPPVTYNRRRQQGSSKQLPKADGLGAPSSRRAQEPPRPGRAVATSNPKASGSSGTPEVTSFANPVGSPRNRNLSDVEDRKKAVKAIILEKKTKKPKEGRRNLLRAFSEQDGIDSPVFEPDENGSRSPVEYSEVSELQESPGHLSPAKISQALGQQRPARDQKSSRTKAKLESKVALPLAELTLDPEHLPRMQTISETQFSHSGAVGHSTPKKKTSGSHGRSSQMPSVSRVLSSSPSEMSFPQPVTRGLSHTELKRPTSPENRPDSPEGPRAEPGSRSPGSEARVHFLSETHRAERRHQQSTPARRIKSPTRQPDPKTPKTPGTVQIEMTALQLDPDHQRRISTPEFKLAMFQRTGRDPHPTERFVRRLHGNRLLDSQGEDVDPFLVPETPTGSPMADDSSVRQATPTKSGVHDRKKKTRPKQAEVMPAENLSVIRVKQSVL